MQDISAQAAEQHQPAKAAIDLYKRKLRPFILDARLYYVSPRLDDVQWDGVKMPRHDARTRSSVRLSRSRTIRRAGSARTR